VDVPREAIRRKPLGHGVGVKERPVNAIGRGSKYPMKADGVGGF
jgi:hypothetical protein